MMSFKPSYFNLALFLLVQQVVLIATCWSGNQVLVEQKTAELRAINDQIAQKVSPSDLKEGDAVEIKATVRLERAVEKSVVVRDLAVQSLKVSKVSEGKVASSSMTNMGSGKIKIAQDVLRQKDAKANGGFRIESLDVPKPEKDFEKSLDQLTVEDEKTKVSSMKQAEP